METRNNMKLFSLSFSVLLSTVFLLNISATIYNEIEPRFYIHNPDGVAYTNTDQFSEKFVKEFGTYTLSNRELFHLAFETLKRYDQYAGQGPQIDFDGETWNVLQLFNNSESVHKALDTTKTVTGKVMLAKLLVSQTSDASRIQKRQAIIKRLISDTNLRNRIQETLTALRTHEAGYLSLIDSKHPLYDESLLHHHNKLPLEESNLYNTEHVKTNKYAQRGIKGVNDLWLLPGPALKSALALAVLAALYNGLKDKDSSWQAKAGYLGAAGVIGAIQSYDISLVVGLMMQRINAYLYIRHHLKQLRYYFNALDKLAGIEEEFTELSELNDEIDQRTHSNSSEIISLKEILHSSSFDYSVTEQDDSFFTQLYKYLWPTNGDAITAFNIFLKQRRNVFQGIALIGSLDAYCSLAEAVIATKRTNTPYTFMNFTENKNPYLQADGFWNPVVHNNITITNNISLGGESSARNGIVTGQPETGKSTTLRSVGLLAALGQGPGICPARRATITPFSAITMYGNIKDDMANKRSLFRSEVHRASMLLNEVRRREPGEFSLTLTDEAFGGTEKHRGQAAAYASAYLIGSEPQSIGLHSTYFDDLAELANEFPETFANYSLRLGHNMHTGEQYYPYILEYGANNRPLGTLALRKSRFPQEVISMVEKLEEQGTDYE